MPEKTAITSLCDAEPECNKYFLGGRELTSS